MGVKVVNEDYTYRLSELIEHLKQLQEDLAPEDPLVWISETTGKDVEINKIKYRERGKVTIE